MPYCHNTVRCDTCQLQDMIMLQLALILLQNAKLLQGHIATHFLAKIVNRSEFWQLVPVAKIWALLR